MKLAKDKYGRAWLKKGSTYTLLNINHTGLVPPKIKLEEKKTNEAAITE